MKYNMQVFLCAVVSISVFTSAYSHLCREYMLQHYTDNMHNYALQLKQM